jgi:hypothetical protein
MIPAGAIRDGDAERIDMNQISLELLAGGCGHYRRFWDARWIQKAGLQVGRRIFAGDPGKIAGGRVAFRTSTGSVKKCLAGRSLAGEQKFQSVVLGPAWTSAVRLLKPLMQESDDINNLRAIERNCRHAFRGPAVANHFADEIAVLIVPDKHRAH